VIGGFRESPTADMRQLRAERRIALDVLAESPVSATTLASHLMTTVPLAEDLLMALEQQGIARQLFRGNEKFWEEVRDGK
jgi:ribosomal protein S25